MSDRLPSNIRGVGGGGGSAPSARRLLFLVVAVLSSGGTSMPTTCSAFATSSSRKIAAAGRSRNDGSSIRSGSSTRLRVSRVPGEGNLSSAGGSKHNNNAASGAEDGSSALPSFLGDESDDNGLASDTSAEQRRADSALLRLPRRFTTKKKRGRFRELISRFVPKSRVAAAVTVAAAATVSSLYTASRTLLPLLRPQTEVVSVTSTFDANSNGDVLLAELPKEARRLPEGAMVRGGTATGVADGVATGSSSPNVDLLAFTSGTKAKSAGKQQKTAAEAAKAAAARVAAAKRGVVIAGSVGGGVLLSSGTRRKASKKSATDRFNKFQRIMGTAAPPLGRTVTALSGSGAKKRKGGQEKDGGKEKEGKRKAPLAAAAAASSKVTTDKIQIDPKKGSDNKNATTIIDVPDFLALEKEQERRLQDSIDAAHRASEEAASQRKELEGRFQRNLLRTQLRQDEKDRTERKLNDVRLKFVRLRDEHEELIRSKAESEAKLAEEIETLKGKLVEAESSAADFRNEIKRRDDKERRVRATVEDLERRLAEAEGGTTALRDEYEGRLERSREAERSLRLEVESLRGKLEQAESTIVELEERLSSSKGEIPVDEKDDDEPRPANNGESLVRIKGVDQLTLRPGLKKPTTEILVPSPTADTEEDEDLLPTYGRPLLPKDFEFDEIIKTALVTVREENVATDEDLAVALEVAPEEKRLALRALKSAGTGDAATLTMMGYKGGELIEQVNQDRALIVSPFYYGEGGTRPVRDGNTLLGVFDGHNTNGEVVSEYAIQQLPKVLSAKLEDLDRCAAERDWSDDMRTEETRQALVNAFLDVHESGLAELSLPSGGCTASVVLQLEDKVYIANAGDSQSLIATYSEETGDINVAYVTRADSPDLEDERERVERMGGQVRIIEGEPRVLFVDEAGIPRGGLAVSRSLGDWELGNVGIIPEPIVDVIDLNDIVTDRENVKVFAVSATDGLLDFVEHSDILMKVVEGLYDKDAPHLFTALEDLITQARISWYDETRDAYRDDITISASKLTT